MRVSSASGRAHERHARGGVEDRAAGGARRGRGDASGPHRADVADPRVRGPDRRRAGQRERQAVRAGPRCRAVPRRRGHAAAARVRARHAGAGARSPDGGPAVATRKAAGALIAGKTNRDEFGMGSSTEHSAYGRAVHPFDKTRVPGGSSGGSAALVAAGAVPAGLGSETGGSVRQPASFCGIVGIKPTYGRVSRYGLVAFGSSLDQIGVFGRSVHDAARVLSVISGRDPKDSTCEARDSLRLPTVPESLQGFVIGVPKEYFPPDLDAAVRRACDRAIRVLKELGAAVREVSLPHTPYAVPTYYIIAPAEASSNLARYDGARYGPRFDGALDLRALYRATRGTGFGPEVRRRILGGTDVLAAGYYDAYYRRAQQRPALIRQDYRAVLHRRLLL